MRLLLKTRCLGGDRNVDLDPHHSNQVTILHPCAERVVYQLALYPIYLQH